MLYKLRKKHIIKTGANSDYKRPKYAFIPHPPAHHHLYPLSNSTYFNMGSQTQTSTTFLKPFEPKKPQKYVYIYMT